MKILHVVNHTERLSGNVHAAVDLACEQARQGHVVTIASRGGDFDALLHENGVNTVIFDSGRNPLSIAKGLLTLTKSARNADVMHAHMVASALLAKIVSVVTRVPLVATVHNEFDPQAIGMNVSHRVIAVSSRVGESMIKRGVPSKKLKVVLNGTIGSARLKDIAEPIDLGDRSILFVGGLHPRKGVDILIKAFALVSEQLPDATLHILGEGPHGDEYRSLAQSLPCSEAIVFHGAKDNPRPWYSGTDVFVLPSLSEPAALVLSEASEGGCAIVGSDVGGIGEMLNNGQAGVLVPPGEPSKLAEALIDLFTTPGKLDRMKQASCSNRPRMAVERVAKETVGIYRELVRH